MSSTSESPLLTRDDAYRARARRVIPNGMYGHLNTSRLGPDYPQFFADGDGARVRDVDGREYLDFMCAFGPIVLGHAHPEVDAVAAERAAQGDVLNGPGPEMVELAEVLVDRVPHADWAMFAKNGNDVTTLAVRVARARTRRRKVLIATGAYHGISGWSSAVDAVGMTPEDHANTRFFAYNDLGSLEAAIADAGADDVAAIVCTPVRQGVFSDQDPADPAFAHGVREACDRLGAALIMDDVRCGVRLDPRGGWASLGIEADLSAWSKSLANGYPLAALLGAEPWREAAGQVIATGSFWYAAAPMAAALATIRILDESDGVARMRRSGERLRAGLARQAEAHGFSVRLSGPPQLPLMLFDEDPEFTRSLTWANACARRGVYLHPVHNWFIATAHTDATIDEALERTDGAFADLRQSVGD